MAEKITPLTTEHLRIMRADIASLAAKMDAGFAKMSDEFEDMKKRFRVQEHHITGLRRDEVVTAEEIVDLRHQIDTLLIRLKRLEDHAAH